MGKGKLGGTVRDEVSGVKWGKLGPAGGTVGRAEGGTGQGGTSPCVMVLQGCCTAGQTDRASQEPFLQLCRRSQSNSNETFDQA